MDALARHARRHSPHPVRPELERVGKRRNLNILGISAFYHDSAAALVVDGRIPAAAREERFTRVKHDSRFPCRAVQYCLEAGGLKAGQLDSVAFYEKPLLRFERLLETYIAYAPLGFRQFLMSIPLWLKKKLHLPRGIDQALEGQYRGRCVFTEHHESTPPAPSSPVRLRKPSS